MYLTYLFCEGRLDAPHKSRLPQISVLLCNIRHTQFVLRKFGSLRCFDAKLNFDVEGSKQLHFDW